MAVFSCCFWNSTPFDVVCGFPAWRSWSSWLWIRSVPVPAAATEQSRRRGRDRCNPCRWQILRTWRRQTTRTTSHRVIFTRATLCYSIASHYSAGIAMAICLCLSQVEVLLKWLDEPSWFLNGDCFNQSYTVLWGNSGTHENRVLPFGNFFLNSGLGKFRHGISIVEMCYRLSSRNVDAQSVITWTVVGQLIDNTSRAPTLDRCSLSQGSSRRVNYHSWYLLHWWYFRWILSTAEKKLLKSRFSISH